MRIPLPKMMRHWREREFERHLSPAPIALRPRLLGVLRPAAGALPFRHRPRRARDAFRRAQQGTIRLGAAGRRLDPVPRPRRAGADDVSEPVAGEKRGGEMSAREAIFANIRRSLRRLRAQKRRAGSRSRRGSRKRRLASCRSGGRATPNARIATFKAEAERAAATLAEVATARRGPGEDRPLPARQQCAGDVCAWAPTSVSRRCRGARRRWRSCTARPTGTISTPLSVAFAAVAETGTIALVSGADNPTTLNFLPDNQIVVVRREDVVADYESVFLRLREAYGKGRAPRTVNFVTGPSRSADIEQTLLLGAHGPRRLHIVIAG